MTCKHTTWLPLLTVAMAIIVVALPAAAQAPSPTQVQGPDAATLQQILQQMQALQKRVDQLEQKAARAEARATAAQQKVAELEAARPAPGAARPAGTTTVVAAAAPVTGAGAGTAPGADGSAVTAQAAPAADSPKPDPDKASGSFMVGNAKVTLGGYVDLTAYTRSVNENRGLSTGYNNIPFYGPTPQGNTGEFGMSAQATRISGKVEGKLDESKLVAYAEMDFNNGSGGANSVQSASYTPRLRQGFGQYTYEPWQSFLVAGQAWSLATPFSKGLDPFSAWQPPTIDSNYMVGYSWLRTPLLRGVVGFDNVWLGFELDRPQTVFGGQSALPAGQTQFTTFAGSGGLNPGTTYSTNVAPDVIVKGAIDTSFGHFEAFGVGRWFQDQVAYPGTSATYTTFGGGVGGSAFVPVTKYADVVASVLYGNGIGRYGSAGMPDVTFSADGRPVALPEGMGLVGVIGHVVPKTLDLYAFYGWDWIGSSWFPGGGYGNPAFNNAGCFDPSASSKGAAGTCTGNNQKLTEFTAGAWWNIVRGRYGTFKTGVQYGHIERTAYAGLGGTPFATEDLFMFSLRYAPFD
jgi:hypothetical protein